MLQKISILLLVIILLFLGYVYISKINLLEVGGNSDINYYPYIRLSLTVVLSLLLIFKKTKNVYYFLHLLWVIPAFSLLINRFFGAYNIKKLDYHMGKTIDNYDLKQIENRGWIINEITIKYLNKNDIIYISENPSWKKQLYQLNDKEQSKIVKSWVTGYYYVSVKVK